MRKEDAILHFGSAGELARILGVSAQAVSEWGELVPEGRAYQLQVITAGKLQVDPKVYKRREPAAP